MDEVIAKDLTAGATKASDAQAAATDEAQEGKVDEEQAARAAANGLCA